MDKKIIISSFLLLLLLGGLGFGVYKTAYLSQPQNIRSRAANEVAVVKFAGTSGTVKVGETFSMSIIIEPVSQTNAPKLSAAFFTIHFPNDKVLLKSMAPYPQGPLPVAPGTATIDFQNSTGTMAVVASCTTAGCQTQSAGFLLTLTFEARAAGEATISLDPQTTQIAAEGISGPLPVRFENASITIVSPVTPTALIPTPTTPIPSPTTPPQGAIVIPTESTPTSLPLQPEPTTCTTEYVCTPECAANEDPEYKRACANPEPYRNFPEYRACFITATVCN